MTKKIKLYWLHPHFLYWMGGTKYIFEVVKRINSHFDLKVIVENASSYAIKQYQDAGVKLISLDKLSTASLLYWLTFPYQVKDTTRKVKALVPKESKVISSMFPMNIVATSLTLQPLQLCFEPFAFFHDPDFQKGFPFYKRLLLKFLSALYGKSDIMATRKAKEIITLNLVTEKIIKEVYDRESVPVYTGIDTKHFKRYISKELANKYMGFEVIIHSTDYTPVKGTDRMISIFAKVNKIIPKSRLLITTTIDNQKAASALRSQAKSLGIVNSVEFLGFVDYNLLPQLYSLAKVLVQCSYSERSGTTSMALPVKETLACGTPAVRSPVTTEDVVDGITGYLVDPRSEDEMVDKIVKLIRLKPVERQKLAHIARSKIVRQYTWDSTASRISRIIKQL